MNKPKNNYIIPNLTALILGCLLGCGLNITGYASIRCIFAPIGSFYLRVLQFVAMPMMFCLVIVSIMSFPNVKKIIFLFIKTISTNIATTIFAGIVAFFVTIFFVSRNYLPPVSTTLTSSGSISHSDYMDKMMNLVRSNVSGRFMQQYLLVILIVSVLLGVLIVMEHEKLDFLAKIATSLNVVLKKMLDVIVRFAPYGIFAITANTFASNNFAIFDGLLGVICMVCIISIFCIIVSLCVISFVTRESFLACLKAEAATIFFAFATCSTTACVPLAKEASEELGCAKETSSFVIPVTKMLVKAGSFICIYCLIAFVIVANGDVMPLYKWLYLVLVAAVCSLAAPAIPMGSVFVIPTGLDCLGVTMSQNYMGLVIAIYIFVDMFGSATTCSLDICSAVVVDKLALHRKNRLNK